MFILGTFPGISDAEEWHGARATGGAGAILAECGKKQQASGLSVAEFCRQNDVADALFYRWRRKLAELDERNEPPQEVGKSDREGRSEAAARFVPIELSPPPVSDRFEIVRPDGVIFFVAHAVRFEEPWAVS